MTRDEVHELIDGVPEERLRTVAAFIIEVTAGPDEEPFSDSELRELAEGRRQAMAGEGRPLDEVIRDLEL